MNKISPVRFSDITGICPERLKKMGVFNPILNYDTRFFVDPVLLKQSSNPIIQQSHKTFEAHFQEILNALSKTKEPKTTDRHYRAAQILTRFPEYSATCIGYSKTHTRGKGSGKDLSGQILNDAWDIVQSCKDCPSMFLVLPLLEKDIGADRISDMTQHIIDVDICAYTVHIMQELGIEGNYTYLTKNNKMFRLLKNPYSREVIKLLPSDVLTSLPLADTFDSTLAELAEFNNRIRDFVNHYIGDIFHSEYTKAEIKEKLLEEVKANPDFLIEVAQTVRDHNFDHANFHTDPKGRYSWIEVLTEFDKASLSQGAIKCPENSQALYDAILEILDHYKHCIEKQGHWAGFWTDYGGKICHVEPNFTIMQFLLLSSMWLKGQDSNIQIDFINKGAKPEISFYLSGKIKLIPHIHHSSNNDLESSYLKTLEQMQNRPEYKHIFVVFRFTPEKNKSIKKLEKVSFGNEALKVYYIDASRQNDEEPIICFEGAREVKMPDYEARVKGAEIKNQDTNVIKNDVIKPMFRQRTKDIKDKINVQSISSEISDDLCDLDDDEIDSFADSLNNAPRLSVIKARQYALDRLLKGDFGQIPTWCYEEKNS